MSAIEAIGATMLLLLVIGFGVMFVAAVNADTYVACNVDVSVYVQTSQGCER